MINENNPELSDKETDSDHAVIEDIPTATEAANLFDKIRKFVEAQVNGKH